MTLTEFETLLKTADSSITKRKGKGNINYTTWSPGVYNNSVMSDDEPDETFVRVYVDRFTKTENDTVAESIANVLSGAFIPFDREEITEPETGYIHHSFTCLVG